MLFDLGRAASIFAAWRRGEVGTSQGCDTDWERDEVLLRLPHSTAIQLLPLPHLTGDERT